MEAASHGYLTHPKCLMLWQVLAQQGRRPLRRPIALRVRLHLQHRYQHLFNPLRQSPRAAGAGAIHQPSRHALRRTLPIARGPCINGVAMSPQPLGYRCRPLAFVEPQQGLRPPILPAIFGPCHNGFQGPSPDT
jgi:hypothetical protein